MMVLKFELNKISFLSEIKFFPQSEIEPGSYLVASIGEPGNFWCEYIVTYPKNVKSLHEQILADIYVSKHLRMLAKIRFNRLMNLRIFSYPH